MYLLIGDDRDPCIAGVSAQLRARGKRVIVTNKPLSDDCRFAWRLDKHVSSSLAHFKTGEGDIVGNDDWRGVLVRSFGEPAESANWGADDLAYVQTETQAALIAWLKSLACLVVNPPLAENWFRPHRTLPEQQAMFARAGLPTLASIVTNDPIAAREFVRRWNGDATYTPLTSPLRYQINTDSQWQELEKVMTQIPVCLVEPLPESTVRATYVNGEMVWAESIELDDSQRRFLIEGMRRLARLSQLELFQIELLVKRGEARCVSFNGFVQVAFHNEAEREQISCRMAEMLIAGKGGAQ